MARSSSPHPGATRVCGEASCHAKAPRAARTRGFALLITVTLLAFLVLLLVSLAALTRVETQVASNSQQLAQARQNALVALNIALGQLQKYAGPDQRVTGAADLAGGDAGARLAVNTPNANAASVNDVANGLAGVQAGTRYWTGVWGNANPSAPTADNLNSFERTPDPVLLNWLVSGNEAAMLTVSTDPATFGRTAAGTALGYTPTARVTWAGSGSDLSAFVAPADRERLKATDAYTIMPPGGAAAPAALLVGPRTAGTTDRTLDDGSTEAATDRYVAAPLVDINASPGAIPGIGSTDTPVIGRYAWWVGDEGVKARLNLADPYADRTDTATDSLARVRLMTAPRTGLEAIADFSGSTAYTDATQTAGAAGRMLTFAQASLLDAANLTPLKLGQRTHDLTTVSLGIEADTLNGGLRRDLTCYFEQPVLPTWTGPHGLPAGKDASIIPADYSPTGGTATSFEDIAVPQWDVLRSFYHAPVTGATASSPGTVEVQPATITQMGITPVIALFRLQMGVRRTAPGVGGGTYGDFHGLAAPMITLANPYTTKLRATNGLSLEVLVSDDYDPDPTAKSHKAFPWVQLLVQPDGTIWEGGNYNVRIIATRAAGDAPYVAATATSPGAAGFDKGPALLSNVKFIIPAGTTWEPGEAKLFTLQQDLTLAGYGAAKTVPLAEGVAPSTSPSFKAVISPPKPVDLINTRAPKKDVYSARSRGVGTVPLQLEIRDAATGDLLQAVSGANLAMPGGPGSTDYSFNEGTALTALPMRSREVALVPPGDVVYGWNNAGAVVRPRAPGSTPEDQQGQRNSSLRLYQDFNPRASYFRLTNRSFTTAPYTTISKGPVGNPPDGYNLTRFTENVDVSNPQAWGREVAGKATSSSTTKFTLLYDFPRRATDAEMPVTSLGQLQHANLTADDLRLNVGHQPAYAVGNSYVPPFVAREKSIDRRPDVYYTEYGNNWAPGSDPDPNGITRAASIAAGGSAPDSPYYVAITKDGIKQWTSATPTPAALLNRFFDLSHLLNTALWDGYFFSTIPQAATLQTGPLSLPPVNPRLRFIASAEATVSAVLDGRKAAAHTAIAGAFNVNSTSIDAWTALLGGMKHLPPLPFETGGTTVDGVFPRSLRQTATGASVPTGDGADSYGGFRRLTDAQLRTLAAALVQQVRRRGPFVSLAHFINRSLVAATDDANGVGFSGALQSAIDNGKLNEFSAVTPTADEAEIPPKLDLGLARTSDPARDIVPTHNDKTEGRGTWSLYADNENFAAGTTADSLPRRSTGIPGWLTQADVLQVIGPVIAARSDTFTIRTYGEVVNPVTNATTARAWCEAVVQRLPDYVNPAEAATTAPVALTLADNQIFGRRFKIVSFRWLGADDI